MGQLYFVIFLFLYFPVIAVLEGSTCAGYCTRDVQKCKDGGGRIMGFCTNALACCDPLISSITKCGEKKSGQRIIDFKSPHFPFFSSGDLYCHIEIGILNNAIATRIDFVQAEMEGPSFSESEDEPGSCESDMIFLRGFQSWAPPPRCGNLSGYSFLIDNNTPQTKRMNVLSITALMASPNYRWHIRVIQLLKEKSSFYQNSIYDSDRPLYNKGKRSLLNPLLRKAKKDKDEELLMEESLLVEKKYSSRELNDSLKSASSVLNGEDTLISNVPWQVSLRFKLESLKTSNGSYAEEVIEQLNSNCSISEGIHFCGASIIGEWFLLTASHCFYGSSKTNGMIFLSTVKAVVGDTNLCSDSSEEELQSYDYDIDSVTMHYGYDSQLLINDIAVVKLKRPIKYKDHIRPIIMANTGQDFSGSEALLSGWGDYLSVKSSKPLSEEQIDSTTEAPVTTPSSTTTATTTEGATEATTTILPTTSPSLPISSQVLESVTELDIVTTPLPISENISDPTTLVSEASSFYTTFLPLSSTSFLPEVAKLELESPHVLQSSRRFVIQNKTVCNAKDAEQYSASKEYVQKYTKYSSVFDSTLCTLSKDDGYKIVSSGKGDSGSSLTTVLNFNEVPVLVGVVSYGVADNNEGENYCKLDAKQNRTFDYFASVAFYRKWIDLVTLSHQKDSVGLRFK